MSRSFFASLSAAIELLDELYETELDETQASLVRRIKNYIGDATDAALSEEPEVSFKDAGVTLVGMLGIISKEDSPDVYKEAGVLKKFFGIE